SRRLVDGNIAAEKLDPVADRHPLGAKLCDVEQRQVHGDTTQNRHPLAMYEAMATACHTLAQRHTGKRGGAMIAIGIAGRNDRDHRVAVDLSIATIACRLAGLRTAHLYDARLQRRYRSHRVFAAIERLAAIKCDPRPGEVKGEVGPE